MIGTIRCCLVLCLVLFWSEDEDVEAAWVVELSRVPGQLMCGVCAHGGTLPAFYIAHVQMTTASTQVHRVHMWTGSLMCV